VEHNRRLPYSAGQIESELGIGPAAAGRGVLVSDRFGSAALDGCFWPISIQWARDRVRSVAVLGTLRNRLAYAPVYR